MPDSATTAQQGPREIGHLETGQTVLFIGAAADSSCTGFI